MSSGWRSVGLWIVALAVTAALAAYQRRTGPSHPFRGEAEVAGVRVAYALPRSHGGPGGLAVRLDPDGAPLARAELLWRRYPTAEPWRRLVMRRRGGVLEAEIPHQPPAGKVEYRLVLATPGGAVSLPAGRTVVARFRGEVPAWLLVPHILAMFLGMLLATRGALEALVRGPEHGRGAVLAATALLALGGLALGPLVQLHAFGALWTGWPLGGDLTDTKTLLAIALWLPAAAAAWRRRQRRWLLALGWAAMMAAFLIPHSLRGSELDWSRIEAGTPASPQTDVPLENRAVGDTGGGRGGDHDPSADHDPGTEGDVAADLEPLAGQQ